MNVLDIMSSGLASMLLAAASAQTPPPAPPQASLPGASTPASVFRAGLDALGIVFKGIGHLGGPARRGEIWVFDIGAGDRRRLAAGPLSWPVEARDGDLFALRGRQLVQLRGASVVAEGPETDWVKLVGVLPDGTLLALVRGADLPREATIPAGGSLLLAPDAEDTARRAEIAQLAQARRDYADGTQLDVRRSARGGQGWDVYLTHGGTTVNVSDCGDAVCGQPSLSPDGRRVLYVRSND